MKKRKPTKAERELAAQWATVVASHQKPLERGAKSRGTPAKAVAVAKMPVLVVPADRSSRSVPSFDSGKGIAALPPAKTYTGNEVIGIAVMHKSCLQPIFNEEAAKDSAKMRR
jgi:hypothetical protein